MISCLKVFKVKFFGTIHVGAPMDYYDRTQAEEAIKYAERIIKFAEEEIGQI